MNRVTASDSPPPASDSGGTGKTRSNGTTSRARLVASTRNRGQAASSRSRKGATPSRTCSQLSSTSSAWRSASAASTASSMLRPGCSPTPTAAATAAPTRPGSVIGTRSTNHTPSAKSPAASAATASASRVFPTPPGPTAVTCRCVLTASPSSARSRTRPTNVVSGAGRAGAGRDRSARASSAARRESARRSGISSLRSSEETWDSTVRTEMNRRAPISALLRCSPSSPSTSASRAEIAGLDIGSLSVVASVVSTDVDRTRAGRRCDHSGTTWMTTGHRRNPP